MDKSTFCFHDSSEHLVIVAAQVNREGLKILASALAKAWVATMDLEELTRTYPSSLLSLSEVQSWYHRMHVQKVLEEASLETGEGDLLEVFCSMYRHHQRNVLANALSYKLEEMLILESSNDNEQIIASLVHTFPRCLQKKLSLFAVQVYCKFNPDYYQDRTSLGCEQGNLAPLQMQPYSNN
jgi:hypothetical protein